MARMRRSVLVIDDRDGRSLWSQINRNYLGFPDGIPAAEIRLQGRRQAAKYGAKFLLGRVAAADRDGGQFRLLVEGDSELSSSLYQPKARLAWVAFVGSKARLAWLADYRPVLRASRKTDGPGVIEPSGS